MTYEIVTKYIKDLSFKIKDAKSYFLLEKDIKNYTAIIGKFRVENFNGDIDILNPELRIYDQPNIVTSEASIKTNLLTDKFITMNLVQNQEFFNIRYQIKPFMIWIWFSILLITSGGLISMLKKKYEN